MIAAPLLLVLLAGLGTPTEPPTQPAEPVEAIVQTETLIVTADDQGDLYVDPPDEPYTITTTNCAVTVDTTVDTSILIEAGAQGVVAPEGGEMVIFDQPAMHGHVVVDPAIASVWDWTVVVIVNDWSQVSQERGTITCKENG